VTVLETNNGRVQVSGHPGESQIGLLVERDSLFAGTLLSPANAQELARVLLKRAGLHEADDT
jgi:hypothetical protein